MEKKESLAKRFKKSKIVFVNGKRVVLKSRIKVKSNFLVNFTQEKFFIGPHNQKDIAKLKKKNESQQIKDVEQVVSKTKSKKSKISSLIFFLINIVVLAIILIVQIKKEGTAPIGSVSVNWLMILATVGLFSLVMIIDQTNFITLIHKSTKTIRPNLSLKLVSVGRYYDAVTPFASGGQPFQIYYLNKYGVRASSSVSIVLGKYIFNQIGAIVFYSVVLFSNLAVSTSTASAGNIAVGLASWIGYAIVIILVFLFFLISQNKRIGASVVVFFLKIGHKLKIVKDYRVTFVKVIRGVKNWQSTMKDYRKSYFIIPFNSITHILSLALYYSIPFFIFCAFEGWNASMWWQLLTMAVMVDLAVGILPLPGGTGAAEISFVALFGSLFSAGNVFWALLIWRFFSFYGHLLLGFLTMSYDITVGDKKLSKHKEKWLNPKNKKE